MAKLQTRTSVMAIKKETTEGTAVVPSAATDFIPIHEGFSMDPAFNELESPELQPSLGQSKNTLGLENPSAAFDLFLKHSGVEGQAPNIGPIFEALFGTETVNGTEYDTVVGSTVSAINVDTGEGAQFAKGQALLVKDATNGYSVANVKSIAGDVLTPAFNLANAPGTGVNLGKCVAYSPANSLHPTLSMWLYRANGGALEHVAGARPLDMSVDVAAAEFITGSFSFEGIEYKFNPIVITSSNKYLDFDDAGGEENAVIAEGVYKDPYELAEALQTAMDALTADTITVTYDDVAKKYTIASDGATLSLLWNTGTNTANTIGGTLGFVVAADDTGSLSYVADNAQSHAAAFTPDFDDTDPLVAKANQVQIGDNEDTVCFHPRSISYSFTNEKSDSLDMCAESGKSGTVITGRTITIDVVADLAEGQSEEFHRFHKNSEISFAHTFGEKSAGNWVAGKVVNMFGPNMRISAHSLDDVDGIVTLNMSLQAFVKDGDGEFFMNFL